MTKANMHCAVILGLAFAWCLGGGAASANETRVDYDLAPGAYTDAIDVPVANKPVQLIGVQTTPENRGVGQATLLRVAPATFLEWIGIDIAMNQPSSSTQFISSGFTKTVGYHIIWPDFNRQVDVEVASATQVEIHNSGSTGTARGAITFIW